MMAWRFTKSQTGYLDEYWGLDSSGNCYKDCLYKQLPRSPRRNGLPVQRGDGALLMHHQYPACALG